MVCELPSLRSLFPQITALMTPPDRLVSRVKLGKEFGAVTMSGSGRMSLCWMAWS